MHGTADNGFDPSGNPFFTQVLLDAAFEGDNRPAEAFAESDKREGRDSLFGRTCLLTGSQQFPGEINKVAPIFKRSEECALALDQQVDFAIAELSHMFQDRISKLERWHTTASEEAMTFCQGLLHEAHSERLEAVKFVWERKEEVAKFEKKIGWLEDKPESNANLRAIDELYEKKEEQEDLMQPYTQMEQFYHGIFMRLTHADHDFMIIGADGPRSSRHRADYYTNVYDTHEVSAL